MRPKLPVAMLLPRYFKTRKTSIFIPGRSLQSPKLNWLTDGTQNVIKLTPGFPATRPLHVELHDIPSQPRLDRVDGWARWGKGQQEGERHWSKLLRQMEARRSRKDNYLDTGLKEANQLHVFFFYLFLFFLVFWGGFFGLFFSPHPWQSAKAIPCCSKKSVGWPELRWTVRARSIWGAGTESRRSAAEHNQYAVCS